MRTCQKKRWKACLGGAGKRFPGTPYSGGRRGVRGSKGLIIGIEKSLEGKSRGESESRTFGN